MGGENERRIRLASASPRRHELLKLTGWALVISPVKVDEEPRRNEDPAHYAKRLALEKADAESRNGKNSDIILAADTIVVEGDRILGKPTDRTHARQMLKNLRGKSHRVITALALIDQQQNKQLADFCETEVPMRMISDEVIEEYIASGDPMDKAGAYAIQNIEFNLVDIKKMIGCYTNVMGLPLCHLTRIMVKVGLKLEVDIAMQCRLTTKFDCQVFEDVLSK